MAPAAALTNRPEVSNEIDHAHTILLPTEESFACSRKNAHRMRTAWLERSCSVRPSWCLLVACSMLSRQPGYAVPPLQENHDD
jgi:hypothetical protein